MLWSRSLVVHNRLTLGRDPSGTPLVPFGPSAGPPPDRFPLGLATLTLFAEEHSLICIVDDG
jgi:hypothetical protein